MNYSNDIQRVGYSKQSKEVASELLYNLERYEVVAVFHLLIHGKDNLIQKRKGEHGTDKANQLSDYLSDKKSDQVLPRG